MESAIELLLFVSYRIAAESDRLGSVAQALHVASNTGRLCPSSQKHHHYQQQQHQQPQQQGGRMSSPLL